MVKLTAEQMIENIKSTRLGMQDGILNKWRYKVLNKTFLFVEESKYGAREAKVGINVPLSSDEVNKTRGFNYETAGIVSVVAHFLSGYGEIFANLYCQKNRDYLHVIFVPFSKSVKE